MSSAPTDPETLPTAHGDLRSTLLVLEELTDALAATTGASESIQVAVEAARSGTGADAGFWYARGASRATGLAGPVLPEPAAQFARRLLAAVPTDLEVFRWVNPDPAGPDAATAAVVARTPRAGGCLVVVGFAPGRRFDPADEEVVRMALKLLAGQRAHAHVVSKQILNGLIHSLTAVIDAKDPYTAGHSERVARIAVVVGEQMGFSAGTTGDLFLAGLLHDLGKIGVRDEVLWKPGSLTPTEYEEIKQHPAIGERVVASIPQFKRLCPAVRHHHERYDGKGYPDGLAGEAIPLPARVLAVADAIDAMMSPRRYRSARSPVEIDRIVEQETGRQFDPVVAAAFTAVRHHIYPPIYQKGIGESAFHAIENLVETPTETNLSLPQLPPGR